MSTDTRKQLASYRKASMSNIKGSPAWLMDRESMARCLDTLGCYEEAERVRQEANECAAALIRADRADRKGE